MSKQIVAPSLAVEAASVRSVMAAVAADVLAAYDGHCPEDRGFLYECKRPENKRDFDNLARMVRHARASGNLHAVSDAIRAYEVATAPAFADASLLDVSLDLEEADVALDRARVAYASERTPTRAAVLWECGKQVMRKATELVDLAARKMTSPLSHARTP